MRYGTHDEKWNVANVDTSGAPLGWRKTRSGARVVGEDLFEMVLSPSDIDERFAVMALSPDHTFQVLTKHPGQMQRYFSDMEDRSSGLEAVEFVEEAQRRVDCDDDESKPDSWHRETERLERGLGAIGWMWEGRALPNVHLGVKVSTQAEADERIPHLLKTPAALRIVEVTVTEGIEIAPWLRCKWPNGLSAGPDLQAHPTKSNGEFKIDWVILRGATGPNAGPTDIAHVRSLIEQCKAAGVPCYVESVGLNPVSPVSDPGWALDGRLRSLDGSDPSEWPEDLRVRQYPEGVKP